MKNRVIILLTAFMLTLPYLGISQAITWANKVEFEYNPYESNGLEWTGEVALGAPDAFPYGELSPRAFRLKTEKSYGRLVVSFDKPMPASQIWIVESYLPGRITKVILFDENNDKYAAYDGKPQELAEPWRNFIVDLGKKTDYNIMKIEINMISIQAPGWSQIDAIGVSDATATVVQQELQKLDAQATNQAIAGPIKPIANNNLEITVEEQKAIAEAKAAEELRIAEEKRIEEEERLRKEEEQRREEEQRLEEERKKEEEKKKLEEEEKRKKEELERKRQEEAERKKREEEERKRIEQLQAEERAEALRQAELKRKEEERAQLEEEKKRQEEEKRKAEEAERKANEEAERLVQQKALEEAQRLKEIEERKIQEARLAELRKAEEEAKKAAEAIKMASPPSSIRQNNQIKQTETTLPPIPSELAALPNRKEEVIDENITATKLELITRRRELDLKALEVSRQTAASFIQTASIRDLSVKPDITEDFRRQSVGDGINTPYAEVKPIITADGQTLYFSRQQYPENLGGEEDDQDIYVARIEDGEWGMAQNIGEPLNNKFPNGVIAVAGDGNTLLLINKYDRRGRAESGLSITKRSGNTWSFPEPLEIENNYNRSDFGDYFLSANGKIMLLAVQRRDTKGDQDLYVSFDKGNNQWSEPIHMGAAINSSEADFSPFLAPDNRTLYFASYGHNSKGGPDIYMSKRLDKSWTNWSPPKNLGNTINSAGFEAYFTIPAAGDYAYLVTDQGGIENSRDIYVVAIPSDFMPDPVLTVMGRVLDANTLEPIQAKLVVESILDGYETAGVETNAENGEFEFILPSKDQYQIRSLAPGYGPVNEVIDLLNHTETGIVEKTFYLKPIDEILNQKTIVANENQGQINDRKVNDVAVKEGALEEEILLRVNGTVSSIDGSSLSSNIMFMAVNDSSTVVSVVTDNDGQFELQLPYGINFTYRSNASGYFNIEGKIDYSESNSDRSLTLDLVHSPIETGITETLPNILFMQGADILLDGSYPELDSIANFLVKHPSVEILLSGHTDGIGDAALNMKLSEDRVKAVKAYLVGEGVLEKRISIEAFGGTKPIASNASERTRRLNRRVELTILKN
ncbi:OmpA family protein [Fulvivirgaceae bacterium LMO-SS25]